MKSVVGSGGLGNMNSPTKSRQTSEVGMFSFNAYQNDYVPLEDIFYYFYYYIYYLSLLSNYRQTDEFMR